MTRRDHPAGDLVEGSRSASATTGEDDRWPDTDRPSDLRGDPPRDRRRDPAPDLEGDPTGDLASDLAGDLDEDEVWFEAEALAAASRVELGSAPLADADEPEPFTRAPVGEQLLAALERPGISLAALPGWPCSGPAGHGLGAGLAALVGELRPGDLIVVSGSRRGVGRTSLLAQLADGLALRDEEDAPLTPVLCAVDLAPSLWRARSLARWSGLDARAFIDSGHAHPELAGEVARFGAGPGPALDRRQRFIEHRALAEARGRAELLEGLERWRRALDAAQVWPVLVVDPVEHVGDSMLATLAALERLARDASLIVLASCDEPAASPGHDSALTRGLDRHARARLRLSTPDPDEQALALELCHRRLGPKGRVQLRWDRASGRITPA